MSDEAKVLDAVRAALPSEAQRDMAKCDAWYVFGVDKVVNRIEVHRS